MYSDLGLREEILAGREEKKELPEYEETITIYGRFWPSIPVSWVFVSIVRH